MIESMLRANGERCWDGASADVRRDIPRDIDAARIVQYHSCRGLEGWTVVAAALDELWEGQHENGHATGAQLISNPEEARTRAARWIMIPLSRAMDTLVINVRSAESGAGAVLRTIADRMSDVVEWRGRSVHREVPELRDGNNASSTRSAHRPFFAKMAMSHCITLSRDAQGLVVEASYYRRNFLQR